LLVYVQLVHYLYGALDERRLGVAVTSLANKTAKIRQEIYRKDIRTFLDPSTQETVELHLSYDVYYPSYIQTYIRTDEFLPMSVSWSVESEWPDLSVSQRIGLNSLIVRAWELWICDFQSSTLASYRDRPFTAAICRQNIRRLNEEEMF
jgi:hypothetical protein